MARCANVSNTRNCSSTLAVLGKFPPGSQLIMDFAMPDATHPDEQLQDPVGELNRVVSEMGEPLKAPTQSKN